MKIVALTFLMFFLVFCSMEPERKKYRYAARTQQSTVMIDLSSVEAIQQVEGKPINGYHLKVFPAEPGCSEATVVNEFKAWFKGKIIRSVGKNCDVVIALQFGTLSADKNSLERVYFENYSAELNGQKIKIKDLDSTEAVHLQLRLRLTEAGWSAGYAAHLNPSAESPEEEKYIEIGVNVETDSLSSLEYMQVAKAEVREGMQFPVYWFHQGKVDVRPIKSQEVEPHSYVDLWLAKELEFMFDALNKKFGLTGIEHLGIHKYRYISGTKTLSRHSFALAIDLGGFRFSDGRRLTIEDDWNSEGADGVLHQIRDLFCFRFDVVLSPDYNDDHYNHLHVDLDPDKRAVREEELPHWDDLSEGSNLSLFSPSLNLLFQPAVGPSLALHSGNTQFPDRTCR